MRGALVIGLVSIQTIPSDISDEGLTQKTVREIYANPYSVSLEDSLAARNERLKLVGKVEIYSYEYNGEPSVMLGGHEYRVLAAATRGDKTVLSYGEVLGSD